MSGLDFWATDDATDRVLPLFDAWSTSFLLYEWMKEITREEIIHAIRSAHAADGPDGCRHDGSAAEFAS
jgi:hypothetical protein